MQIGDTFEFEKTVDDPELSISPIVVRTKSIPKKNTR